MITSKEADDAFEKVTKGKYYKPGKSKIEPVMTKLRKWRKVEGEGHGSRGEFSQAVAARFIGVPVRTYQEWEQGRWAPAGLALAHLLQILKTKPRIKR